MWNIVTVNTGVIHIGNLEILCLRTSSVLFNLGKNPEIVAINLA